MIDLLRIKDFKCFENLRLPLRPLTLLSGANASGKSSILQALALLHQTIRDHEWSTRLMLNGYAIKLGTVTDVVDKAYGTNRMEIGVGDDRVACTWYLAGDRDDMSMDVDMVDVCHDLYAKPSKLHYLFPPEEEARCSGIASDLRNLCYLSAERLGPREVYPLQDRQSGPVVGPSGEFTASVLIRYDDTDVRSAVSYPNVLPSLRHQTAARMQSFFPGCELDYQKLPQTNTVSLGLRNSNDVSYHRAINVGYGITQVLPIVVAGLVASPGRILIVENPEVHLHPAGQAQMGQFLAELASTGVQVIIETHSDHVLNGVRRSVKSGNLQAPDVAIHFFRPRSTDKAQVYSPIMDSSGNIDSWPEGFFDQFDKDMTYFAEWGE